MKLEQLPTRLVKFMYVHLPNIILHNQTLAHLIIFGKIIQYYVYLQQHFLLFVIVSCFLNQTKIQFVKVELDFIGACGLTLYPKLGWITGVKLTRPINHLAQLTLSKLIGLSKKFGLEFSRPTSKKLGSSPSHELNIIGLRGFLTAAQLQIFSHLQQFLSIFQLNLEKFYEIVPCKLSE